MPLESPLTPFDYMREGPIRECEPRIILKAVVMVCLSIFSVFIHLLSLLMAIQKGFSLIYLL